MLRHHHQISTTIAVALALAVAAPSAASARFTPNPVPATKAQSVEAGPRSIVTPGGYGAPSTSNMPNTDIRYVQAQGARVANELAARDAATGSPAQSPPPVQIIKVSQPNGFDWGDAGIGAGAAIALTLVFLGSALHLTHRHTARLSQPS